MKFDFGQSRVRINMPTRAKLMAEVRRRFQSREGFALATINLDHLAKLTSDEAFARAYSAQDMVVADGRSVFILSRIAGSPVELLPGSDLVFPLAGLAAEENVPVALVGSSQQALADARSVLIDHVPGLNVVWTHAPDYGFDPGGEAAAQILSELAARGVGLCFLALGAPRQEVLALRGRDLAPGVGFASVGAGLDFLGDHQVRAPRWMRQMWLEWLWRMLSDPVRMVPRYARGAMILPGQIAAARRLRRTGL